MNTLTMWVVYDHPRDYPDDYVARQWKVSAFRAGETNTTASVGVLRSDDLETMRMWLAGMGRVNIGRYEQDDPKIVEVWV